MFLCNMSYFTLGADTGLRLRAIAPSFCPPSTSSRLPANHSTPLHKLGPSSTRKLSRSLVAHAASNVKGSPRVQAPAPDVPHVPVLLEEIRGLFRSPTLKVYVDGTLGAGGHASAILEDNPSLSDLVGFDQDPTALEIARARLLSSSSSRPPTSPPLSLRLIRSNFKDLGPRLRAENLFGSVDAILLDLGMSSMQVDSADRGFSFLRDAPLDMRMDPSASVSADVIVNTWPEAEIGRIIREYGEDRDWKGIARRIAEKREEAAGGITTTFELLEALGCPPGRSRGPPKGIHPATRTFQALRIAVNDELGVLRAVLPDALECLAPGGRLGIISFHSLEDRIVKRAFAKACGKIVDDEEDEEDAGSAAGRRPRSVSTAAIPMEAPPATHRAVVRRALVAAEAETSVNPRSRSAKYRIVERLGLDGEPVEGRWSDAESDSGPRGRGAGAGAGARGVGKGSDRQRKRAEAQLAAQAAQAAQGQAVRPAAPGPARGQGQGPKPPKPPKRRQGSDGSGAAA